MEEGRSTFKILSVTPTGKSSLGSARRRWEDNIGISIEEIGVSKRNFVDSTEDRNYW